MKIYLRSFCTYTEHVSSPTSFVLDSQIIRHILCVIIKQRESMIILLRDGKERDEQFAKIYNAHVDDFMEN